MKSFKKILLLIIAQLVLLAIVATATWLFTKYYLLYVPNFGF